MATNVFGANGFAMKWDTPQAAASRLTSSSTSVAAEKMTGIAAVAEWLRSRRTNSQPLIVGIRSSVITRSGGSSCARSSASSLLDASRTV